VPVQVATTTDWAKSEFYVQATTGSLVRIRCPCATRNLELKVYIWPTTTSVLNHSAAPTVSATGSSSEAATDTRLSGWGSQSVEGLG
jgi:hypothetical protein